MMMWWSDDIEERDADHSFSDWASSPPEPKPTTTNSKHLEYHHKSRPLSLTHPTALNP